MASGDEFDVSWRDSAGRKFDWIGIYAHADADVYNYLAFVYTGATVDGTYTFTADDLGTAMLPPGDYEVRLMSDDSYVTLAADDLTVTETP